MVVGSSGGSRANGDSWNSGLVQTPGTYTQMPLRSSQMPVTSTSGSEAVLIDASRRGCFMTVAGRTAQAVGAPRRLQTKLPLILY